MAATDIVELSSSTQPELGEQPEVSAEVTVATEIEPASVSLLISRSLQAVHGSAEEISASVVRDEFERSFHEDSAAAAGLYGAEEEVEERWREHQHLQEENNDDHLPTFTSPSNVMEPPSVDLQNPPTPSPYTSDLPSLPHNPSPPLPPPGYGVATREHSTTSTQKNTNNSNSCEPCERPPPAATLSLPPPHLPPMVAALGTSGEEPPKKRAKFVKHGNIEVTLEGKNLWDEFYHRGTEMIVNRSGRRMFPGFSVAVSGLKPKTKYTMKLEVVLTDNHRFKFLNARWLAVGTAEPQPLSESYIHPDSPNSGAFWMRHGISFRKLKITNNKERPGHNALLHSMHKYSLRLIIEEERKIPPGEEKLQAKTVLKMDFPETTFVAVTAYQNEEVTQLKITNNPFAKAFRESAADMDWETAQMLYGNQNIFSPLIQPDGFGAHHPRVLPSPLLPPTPLTASAFPPISPLTGLPTQPGYLTPQGAPYAPYCSVASPHYFQWPPTQQPSNTNSMSHRMPPTQSTNPLHHTPAGGEHYNFQPLPPHHKSQLDHAPHSFTYSPQLHHPHQHHQLHTAQPNTSTPSLATAGRGRVSASNLPDFDSVFTPPFVGSHNHS